MEDKFEMGGEVSVAAGPVGRTAAATTNATLDAGILSYSRSRGAFIGAALKGGVINPDNDLNEAVYDGRKAREVLNDPKLNLPSAYDRYGDPGRAPQDRAVTEMPAGVGIFPATLSRYSRR
jgi:lipid-binding SYLF domain-containing protein